MTIAKVYNVVFGFYNKRMLRTFILIFMRIFVFFMIFSLGADIMPIYLFGNTSAIEIMRNSTLEFISRKLKMGLTLLYGRYFLPIPYRCDVIHVRGKIIDLPHISEPSEKIIDYYHKIYIKEISRLFYTYRKYTMHQKERELLIL